MTRRIVPEKIVTPLIVCAGMAFMGFLLHLTLHDAKVRDSAAHALPKGTIVFRQYAAQDGVKGDAAVLPNGKWLFRPAGSTTYQEVQP